MPCECCGQGRPQAQEEGAAEGGGHEGYDLRVQLGDGEGGVAQRRVAPYHVVVEHLDVQPGQACVLDPKAEVLRHLVRVLGAVAVTLCLCLTANQQCDSGYGM